MYIYEAAEKPSLRTIGLNKQNVLQYLSHRQSSNLYDIVSENSFTPKYIC
jgi:hypothetical protein